MLKAQALEKDMIEALPLILVEALPILDDSAERASELEIAPAISRHMPYPRELIPCRAGVSELSPGPLKQAAPEKDRKPLSAHQGEVDENSRVFD